jgi:pteridine reductase
MADASELTGKVALITGGAKRIGAEIASTLHRQGMNLVIHCRSSHAEAVALALQLNAKRADSAMVLQLDLDETGRLAGLVAEAAGRWGRLDVLVNNASSFFPTPVGSITEHDWERLMGSNLKAPLFLSQASFPHLAANRGCIVNMVDIHARRPMRKHPVYCMAKAGLVMLTQSLAREMGPDVRVNGVAPGAILWPDGDMSADTKARILERTALKRIGEPADIARAVLYLARDAGYVTGHIIPVDGGRGLNI